MAHLLVDPELLVHALFPDKVGLVEIKGCSWDPERGLVRLQIEGIDVPQAEEVVAIFTQERRTTRFEPR